MTKASDTHELIVRLQQAGISLDDANKLRRISSELHRWHELECGTEGPKMPGCGNVTLSIERDGDALYSAPFLRTQYMGRTGWIDTRVETVDREARALKRLAAIMANYPTLRSYVQGDPRGCALYILRPGDVPEGGADDSYYNRGIAVYK